MTLTAANWQKLSRLQFRFEKHSNNRYQEVDKHLNNQYSDKINLKLLFTDTNRETLKDDVVPIIQDTIVSLIENGANPTSRQTIKDYLDQCPLSVKIANDNEPTIVRLRDSDAFEDAVEQTLANDKGRLTVWININKLYFDMKRFNALDFDHISLRSYSRSETPEEAPQQAVSPQELAKVLTNLAKITESITNNQRESNSDRISNSNSNSYNLPSNFPWNTNNLPHEVKARYSTHQTESLIAGNSMTPYSITYPAINDDSSPITITQNYYIDRITSRLITRDGMCFDLTRTDSAKEPSRDKTFLAGWPTLKESTPHGLRDWYNSLTTYSAAKNIYIHPYFCFRADAISLKGFDTGTDVENNRFDLPQQYEMLLSQWGSLIYQALTSTKGINNTCTEQIQQVSSVTKGHGYDALWALIH